MKYLENPKQHNFLQKSYKPLSTIVNMFMLSQEVEVWYIIPSLRKEYAKILTSEYKLSYERTGRILGISKAAVSQYISDKRANKVKLSQDVKDKIKESAKKISENESLWVKEVQKILDYMKETHRSCDVCKKYNKEIIQYCKADPKY